jgi:UDP-glucuronate 4-epimerase
MHLDGIPVVYRRVFTVYGPRQRPDLAIYKFTEGIESGQPLPIFGEVSPERDYTHVDDIVAGVMAALAFEPAPIGGVRYEIYNLGNSPSNQIGGAPGESRAHYGLQGHSRTEADAAR